MKAAVPVVKFVEGRTNIECDVSMENRDGVLKSELLGVFALIDPRFRQLCFLVCLLDKISISVSVYVCQGFLCAVCSLRVGTTG